MSNTQTAQKEDLFYTKKDNFTDNKFVNFFINYMIPEDERDVSEEEINANLDTDNGKIKNCGDIFDKYKDKLMQREFLPKAQYSGVPYFCRPWNEIAMSSKAHLARNLQEIGKLIVDHTKIHEARGQTLCDGKNTTFSPHPGSHYESNCNDVKSVHYTNGGTLYMDWTVMPSSYTGPDPRIKPQEK